ncbi:MAG: hypothetical protein IJY81_06860, partial [Lachnospiraceae bacterium]|nr:hypothetical protein [Lachnospiraceae bacterium]
IAVIIFFILLLFYMKMRRKNPSKLGVAIDVALSFFCIIPFFYAYGILHTYLSEWLAAYYDKMG